MLIRRARRIAERVVAARNDIYPGVEHSYSPSWMAARLGPRAAARFKVPADRVGPAVLRRADREWDQQVRMRAAVNTHTALLSYLVPPVLSPSPFISNVVV